MLRERFSGGGEHVENALFQARYSEIIQKFRSKLLVILKIHFTQEKAV